MDAVARLSALGPATLGSNAMRLAVLQLLGKILPLCFPPPAILQVTKANVSYSTIERQMSQETMSLLAAVLAPAAFVLCALAGAAGRIPLLARSTTGAGAEPAGSGHLSRMDATAAASFAAPRLVVHGS